MKSNRTFPQGHFDAHSFKSTATLEEGCCGESCDCKCCSRRALCISGTVLFCLTLAAIGVGLATRFGIPVPPPINRDCRTPQNGTGFLCDDRITCIQPSDLCNGAYNCPSGADESKQLCSDLPHNLPNSLIFRCGNPKFWIFIDQKCNYLNDCGDCSDEIGISASCPPCGPEWWTCTPVEFMYCNCVPRQLCRDGRQQCYDWSDEYICV